MGAIKVAERAPLLRWLTSRRYAIVDRSMEPTLRPGDRVLVDRRAFTRRRPVPGEVVALTDPEDPARWLVKRVAAVGPGPSAPPVPGDEASAPELPGGRVYLRADAPGGRDSRNFGSVPLEALRGAVWYRIGPAGSRGPIGARRG